MVQVKDGGAAARGAAWKIVLSVVIVTGAVGFLLSRSVKEGAEYYKHVDEVMADPDTLRSKRLQVHGNVVKDSIMQSKSATLQYRFQIESLPPRTPAVISATYTGLVPDTFKSGAEVVAKGTIGPDNVLQIVPDGIMAKCPSKYEAGKTGVNAAAAAKNAPSATTKL